MPDETLSSWFVRVAAANGLTAAELYGTLFPRALKKICSDHDRVAPADMVGALAAGTGLDEAAVRATTFAEWEGRIFDAEDVSVALHWVPPIGQDLSLPTFGQQFCPLCLAEDETSYFRRRWRMKFVVACERHRVFLADRCAGCGKPIQPLRLVRTRRRLECPHCGRNLPHCDALPAEGAGYQQRLLEIARAGAIDLPGGERIPALQWFDLLRCAVRLLSSHSKAAKLRRMIARAEPRLEPMLSLPIGAEAHALAAKARHQLLASAVWLLEGWPYRFFATTRAAGVKQHQLDGIWLCRVGGVQFGSLNQKAALVSPK